MAAKAQKEAEDEAQLAKFMVDKAKKENKRKRYPIKKSLVK